MRRRMTTMIISSGLLVGALVFASSALGTEDQPPPAGPSGSFTLTASGDIGSSPAAAATTEQISALGSELHLALGDLSYGAPGEETAWCAFVEHRVGRGFAYELIPGNHEASGESGFIDAFAGCLPNRVDGLVGTYPRQYRIDVPADDPLARLIVISPALEFPEGPTDYTAGSEGYLWTQEAIAEAHADGIPWVIVAMHKPCLSIGRYGCDPGADLSDLLVSEQVDLVLSGHEHLYQRSMQLALSAECASTVPGAIDQACVVDRDDELAKGSGTVFVTVGTGGTDLRNVNPADPDADYFAAWAGANTDPAWGSLLLRMDADTLRAEFVHAVGAFDDRFTITVDEAASGVR